MLLFIWKNQPFKSIAVVLPFEASSALDCRAGLITLNDRELPIWLRHLNGMWLHGTSTKRKC